MKKSNLVMAFIVSMLTMTLVAVVDNSDTVEANEPVEPVVVQAVVFGGGLGW